MLVVGCVTTFVDICLLHSAEDIHFVILLSMIKLFTFRCSEYIFYMSNLGHIYLESPQSHVFLQV